MKTIIIILFYVFTLSACGQTTNDTSAKITGSKSDEKLDLSKITNENVRKAIEVWQIGDSKTFLSYFTNDAELYDDGNKRDFLQFVKDAFGHERFTSIDKVENNGLDIYGQFHTESWGDFNTYFKFHINNDGKINRLDIGQAN